MAIIRTKELRELSKEEVEDKLIQLKNDLMKIRGVLASGGIPENIGKAREIRKTIARINTYKNKEEKQKTKTKNKKK